MSTFMMTSKLQLGRAAARKRMVAPRAADPKADKPVSVPEITGEGSPNGPPPPPENYVKSLPGACPPTNLGGAPYFDPFGLSLGAPKPVVKRWAESEITHGRVCMLAAVGFIVGEALEGKSVLFDGVVKGPAINHFQQVPSGLWEPLTLAIGIAESYRVAKGWKNPTEGLFELKDSYSPGDLGFDPLGMKPLDKDELKNLQTKELNNGRLAMIATAGFVAQELVDGKAIFGDVPQ